MGMVEVQMGQKDQANVVRRETAHGQGLDQTQTGDVAAGVEQQRPLARLHQRDVGDAEEIVLQAQIVTVNENVVIRGHAA